MRIALVLLPLCAPVPRELPVEEDWAMCGVIERLGLCDALAAIGEHESVATRLVGICARCPTDSVDADCPLLCVACSPEARREHDVTCKRSCPPHTATPPR